jgi:hypothetical protein
MGTAVSRASSCRANSWTSAHREVLVDNSLGSSLEDQRFMASIPGRSWLTAVLTARAALPVGSIARDWHAAKGVLIRPPATSDWRC